MNFMDAVQMVQDWATANDATVRITRVSGIDPGDGRVWGSFAITSDGVFPGQFAKDMPEVANFFHHHDDDFDFTVGA